MRATLSILGLYNFDTSIFKNLVVPDGVDITDAINSIVFDNAELELIYPEPETMTFLIGLWSKREQPIWERIFRVINMKYNPIENYNRSETWTDIENEDTTANTNGNSTNTHKVTGYNDYQLVNSTQDNVTASENGSGSRDKTTSRTGNVSGNIGVVTSQKMLMEELNVAENVDIYKYISESFKRRFCLMVY